MDAARFAAKWWADRLRERPTADNGARDTGSMLVFLAARTRQQLPEERIARFEVKLEAAIRSAPKELRAGGEEAVALRCDCHPDGALLLACEGDRALTHEERLPFKTRLFVYADRVEGILGYAAPLRQLWPEEREVERPEEPPAPPPPPRPTPPVLFAFKDGRRQTRPDPGKRVVNCIDWSAGEIAPPPEDLAQASVPILYFTRMEYIAAGRPGLALVVYVENGLDPKSIAVINATSWRGLQFALDAVSAVAGKPAVLVVHDGRPGRAAEGAKQAELAGHFPVLVDREQERRMWEALGPPMGMVPPRGRLPAELRR